MVYEESSMTCRCPTCLLHLFLAGTISVEDEAKLRRDLRSYRRSAPPPAGR
jgi:hypothetical protein